MLLRIVFKHEYKLKVRSGLDFENLKILIFCFELKQNTQIKLAYRCFIQLFKSQPKYIFLYILYGLNHGCESDFDRILVFWADLKPHFKKRRIWTLISERVGYGSAI